MVQKLWCHKLASQQKEKQCHYNQQINHTLFQLRLISKTPKLLSVNPVKVWPFRKPWFFVRSRPCWRGLDAKDFFQFKSLPVCSVDMWTINFCRKNLGSQKLRLRRRKKVLDFFPRSRILIGVIWKLSLHQRRFQATRTLLLQGSLVQRKNETL